jgi:KAP P-loop domain protein
MNLLADIPYEYQENDIQYSKVLGIKTFLTNKENKEFLEKNNLIALYGEWGSGKSSIFKTLKKSIETGQDYIPLIFETWKYEKDDNLAFSLLEFILSSLNNLIDSKKENELIKTAYNILRNFSKGISLKIPFSNFIDIDINKMFEEDEKNKEKCKRSLYMITENFIKDFQEKIDGCVVSTNKKILIMIDDLDRCEDESIINLLSALKLMFAVKNIIFICGIDKGAVIQTLLRKYRNKEKSEEYLEKIFSINFNVLKTSKLNLFQNDENIYLKNIKQKIIEATGITNPRKINKSNNKYEFLKEIIFRKNIINEIKNELITNNQEFEIKNFKELLSNENKWIKIEKYFNKIIDLYLFLKIILFEFYKINDIPILNSQKNSITGKEERLVLFYNTIIIVSHFELVGNYSKEQIQIISNILKKINRIEFEKELEEDIIFIINNLYNFKSLKIFLEREVEKYY